MTKNKTCDQKRRTGAKATNFDYEDIIFLPHHQSAERPHMSMHDRAAQFAPFAALTGHREILDEAQSDHYVPDAEFMDDMD